MSDDSKPPKSPNGRGGFRPNSGRPRSGITLARDNYNQQVIDLIAPDIPQIVDALRQKALGVRLLKTDEKGVEYVYTEPPCFKSASYLIDRVAGKPNQSISVDPNAVDVRSAIASTQAAAASYVDPDEDDQSSDDEPDEAAC